MEFSINMQEVIKMSLDTVNGNLNFNFLKRLLEALVLHSGLDRYEMNFIGQDALRAQQVWAGGPDPDEKPLMGEFSMRLDTMYQTDEGESDEMIKTKSDTKVENEAVYETIKIQIMEDDKMDSTGFEANDNDGTLNLKVLKKIEKTASEIPTVVDAHTQKTRQAMQNIVLKLNSLTGKVDKFERMLKDKQTEERHVQEKHAEEKQSDNSSNMYSLSVLPTGSVMSLPNKVPKMVRLQSTPSEISQPKVLLIDEITSSKVRENINVSMITDTDTGSKGSIMVSPLPRNDNEIDDGEISLSYITNKLKSLPAKEKYILNNYEPIVLMKHIEKLLSRMNKMEHDIYMLFKVSETESTTTFSSGTSSDDKLIIEEAQPVEVYSFDLQNSLLQQTILNKLVCKTTPTKFQSVSSVSSKKKESDGFLTIKNFYSFVEDYADKFQIIHDLLTFHNDTIKQNVSVINECVENKLDSHEFFKFKNNVNATQLKIKKDIKEYILRDPEAAGIVNYVKGVTCISCAKPVIMKTTSTSVKHPTKGVYTPRPCSKASQIANQLHLVRKEDTRTPNANNLDLTLCKCVTNIGNHDCNATTEKKQGVIMFVNDLIRTTSLQRWIKSKTP